MLGISGVEVFGDGGKLPIDDPEDTGIVTVVTAAVAGPGRVMIREALGCQLAVPRPARSRSGIA
jgi:hypothetical protein